MSNNPNDTKMNTAYEIVASDIPGVLQAHERELEWQLKVKGHRRGLQAAYFIALPGVGKSEIARTVADVMEREFIDIRAGNYIPSDLRLPGVDREAGVARYYGNEEYPFLREGVDPNGRYFIHSDEMGDATGVMHKVMKQIINDNCLGNLLLPENTLHAASANGLQHGCMSERMPLSNANRFAFYKIKPDVDGFMKWLEEIGLYPELFAFMQSNADAAYDIELTSWDGESNFASFRSLENIGKLLESNYAEYSDPERREGTRTLRPVLEDRLFMSQAVGRIGYKAAKKLESWLEIYETIGSLDRLLRDPEGCDIPSDSTTKWIIACKLVGESTEENVGPVMKIASRLTGRKGFMAAYVAKAIAKSKPKLTSNPAIVQWMKDNTLEMVGRG